MTDGSALLAGVRAAVDAVEDPEVPVTLTDLGVVRNVALEGEVVHVVLRPTRTACPARAEMARRVTDAVARADASLRVEVAWEAAGFDSGAVTGPGARALLQIGYADPRGGPAACPYCGSSSVRRNGEFGGAVCKVPFTCSACGTPFDALRGSAAAGAPSAQGGEAPFQPQRCDGHQ